MYRPFFFALALGAILATSSSILAEEVKAVSISLGNAWSRATPGELRLPSAI